MVIVCCHFLAYVDENTRGELVGVFYGFHPSITCPLPFSLLPNPWWDPLCTGGSPSLSWLLYLLIFVDHAFKASSSIYTLEKWPLLSFSLYDPVLPTSSAGKLRKYGLDEQTVGCVKGWISEPGGGDPWYSIWLEVGNKLTRANRHESKQKRFSLSIRKQFFTMKVTKQLAWVAPRGCEISILEDTQKLSGHGPGQL